MLNRIVPLVALLAALAAAARPAQACEPVPEGENVNDPKYSCGSSGLVGPALGLGLLFAGVDVAFTLHDVVRAAEGKRGSKAIAVAELVVTAPQVYFFTELAVEEPSTLTIGLAVWTGLLSTHALYTLLAPEERIPPPLIPLGANAALVPAGTGIGVVGRF